MICFLEAKLAAEVTAVAAAAACSALFVSFLCSSVIYDSRDRLVRDKSDRNNNDTNDTNEQDFQSYRTCSNTDQSCGTVIICHRVEIALKTFFVYRLVVSW